MAKGARWKYLDDGSNQAAAWREPGFADAAWQEGPAELGYGDGGEATVIGYGGNAQTKHITTYFRHRFDVSDPAEIDSLTLRIRRDDGAVVYVNGQFASRTNMPSASVDYQTRASAVSCG